MTPELRALLSAEGGLVTRQDALDGGLTPSAITGLLRSGVWLPVRRGVYVDATVWEAADEDRGRPRLRTRAAVSTMRRGWVLSHDSAAHEWGMALLRCDEPLVHVTRPGYSSAWTRYGVKHHYARFAPRQVCQVEDVRVLDRARVAVDIGREHGFRHGLVACDSARRLGTSLDELYSALSPMDHWPGVRAAREAVDRSDAGAQSPAETLARELLVELGLGTVETQFPVRTPRTTFWCDLRIGNHVFEVDGRVKYVPTDLGGLADRSAHDVVWEEKQRERLIAAEGLGVSRIFWSDLWGSARAEAHARLRQEFAVTCERFGRTLSPRLAASAAALRQTRSA
ncbi:type IV toxin-antitoxin system AbiEi family antitoxin domain-containing protein [Nocardioides sp. P86]|uniref:type IV toxin-antitoxin system AbiEi family antitoxin domain-containing protein n=1 Tax=Nocardioides sp. P86 TaxID=2939569 RepID=UPI0020403EC8|nr:type IV toxin-antitoxin system AbiEi family antitoxin domain-containing protein [Nocardioides sp. P86]MCM3516988.1 type IV toxin-antitoxin system AbiEi family antitoxin domain-containing protein [Nocardioides sp. P86]